MPMNNLNRLVVPTLLAISAVFAGNAFVDTPSDVARDAKAAITTNGMVPDNSRAVDCDLPNDLHLKNVGGSDGAGLCVFTSISHSARWQHVEVLKDFRDYMRAYPGGSWPQKTEEYVNKICKERGVPVPAFLQVEGPDTEILKLACKTGRMPGVTFSHSPTGRYGGQRIAHMVSLVCLDDNWASIQDSNFPGTIEHMSPSTFAEVYRPGWAFILLANSPSPVPHN